MLRLLLVCILLCAGGLKANDSDVDPKNHPNAHLLPDTCGDTNEKRNNESPTAALYEFPWLALISYRTRNGLQFSCGGSVINSRYILTAAHCVQNKQIAGVRVGEHDLRYPTDCQGVLNNYICESHIQDIRVESFKVHPDYSSLPYVLNDIALLRLKMPIDFSYKNAAPICLPVSGSMKNITFGGRIATVAGWGLTGYDEESDVVLKEDIPILASNECRQQYNKVRIENQLCSGELKKGSCKGDTGGPLMLESEYQGANRIVQYGIVSHGPKQCGSEYPGIFTDVTKFMDWILDNIKE